MSEECVTPSQDEIGRLWDWAVMCEEESLWWVSRAVLKLFSLREAKNEDVIKAQRRADNLEAELEVDDRIFSKLKNDYGLVREVFLASEAIRAARAAGEER
jgi:hypothetical protein